MNYLEINAPFRLLYVLYIARIDTTLKAQLGHYVMDETQEYYITT